MGERADRDVADTCLGHGADGVDVMPPEASSSAPSAGERDRPGELWGPHVVEQDPVGACLQRLV